MGRNVKHYKDELDLRECFFFVLKRGKILLLSAVIVALIAGGLTTIRAWKQKGVPVEKTVSYTEEEIKERETNKLLLNDVNTNIKEHKKNIAEIKKNEEQSLLLQLNADNIWNTKLYYNVEADTDVLTNNILTMYITKIQDGLYDRIHREILLAKDSYAWRELILAEINYEGNTLSVSIKYDDEKVLTEITKQVSHYVNEVTKDIRNEMGEFQIREVDRLNFKSVDQVLRSTQKNNEIVLERSKNQIATLEREAERIEELLEEPETIPVQKMRLSSILKMTFVGAVLGVCLACAISIILFLRDDKVHKVSQLKRDFYLKPFGDISDRKPEKTGKWEHFVEKWERAEQYNISEHEKYQYVAANILLALDKCEKSKKKLLLMGNIDNGKMNVLEQKLGSILEENELIADSIICSTKNVEVLQKLYNNDIVILVVEKDVNRRKEVLYHLNMVEEAEKDVLGVILV